MVWELPYLNLKRAHDRPKARADGLGGEVIGMVS